MRRLILATSFIVLTIISIVPFVGSLFLRHIPENIQPSLDQTVKIYDKIKITQIIKVKHNNFSELGLSIKNPNLANKKDITLRVYDGEVIRNSVLNGAHIQDGKFVKFKFEPILASQNRSYKIGIESEMSNVNDAFEVFVAYDGSSEILVDDQKIPGSLSLVIFYKTPNILHAYFQIVNGAWSRLMGDMSFLVVYSVLLAACGIYLTFHNSTSSFS